MPDSESRPTFRQALGSFLYVGLNSFGGPAGQIAVMQREFVERRQWLGERRFLHALNFCMLLPGPEAQQLATYVGWLLHGIRGGLAAGLLFIAPGVAAIMALSVLYAGLQDATIVQALFYGIKPAVIAVVVVALTRLAARALSGGRQRLIAGAAFVAIFLFDVPFPVIVISAGLAGALLLRSSSVGDEPALPARPALTRSLVILLAGLGAWLGPTLVLLLILGPDSVFSQQAAFFSSAAVVTFGGAYAVLAFVAQQVVEVFAWLTPAEMLDGLALAESTPGPLIMVVQFVGFLAAFRQPGALDPLAAGVLGGLLVSWVTFAPSFLWIFVGAPYAELLRGQRRLAAALSGITAAVVGVILNLALWFAIQTLFAQTGELRLGPLRLHTVELASLDLFGLLLAGFAFVALVRLRWPLLVTLASSAALGFAYYLTVLA